MMKPLWKSYWFRNANDLLHFHYTDLANARRLADNYSAQLALDAYESGADDYVDIFALSARQVLRATTFSGTRDQPILFLKEILSNGNFQAIDVIFPSFPFFLYTSPRSSTCSADDITSTPCTTWDPISPTPPPDTPIVTTSICPSKSVEKF
jgi:hypothetical protein